jgi:hypothetical protein
VIQRERERERERVCVCGWVREEGGGRGVELISNWNSKEGRNIGQLWTLRRVHAPRARIKKRNKKKEREREREREREKKGRERDNSGQRAMSRTLFFFSARYSQYGSCFCQASLVENKMGTEHTEGLGKLLYRASST